MLIPAPLNNNFHVIIQKKSFLAVAICSCTIFILTLYSLYTQVMPILILIDVQYLQKVAFIFEKGLHDQNHSSSGFNHPLKKSCQQNLQLLPTGGVSLPPLNAIWKTLDTFKSLHKVLSK